MNKTVNQEINQLTLHAMLTSPIKKKTLAPKLSITISTGSSYHSRKVVKWVFQVLIFFFFPLLEGKRYNQEREA